MKRALLTVSLAVAVFVGCERLLRSQDAETSNIVRAVAALGGTTALHNVSNLDGSPVPKGMKGTVAGIYLQGIDLRGIDLGPLVPQKTLVLAWFRGATLNDEQLDTLRKCHQLQLLDLNSTSISDNALEAVGSIPTLKEVDLNCCNITDQGLEKLYQCKSLELIRLIDTHVTEAGVAKLREQLPNLKRASWSTAPSQEVRAALAELERHGADVGGAPHNTRRIPANELPIRYLINFNKTWKDVGTEELSKWLEQIATAERTNISMFHPFPEVTKTLASLTRIHRLAILDTANWNDDDVKRLANSVEIYEILLNAPLLTDAAFEHLAAVKGLTKLELRNVNLTAAGIDHLARHPTLAELEPFGPAITDSVLAELKRFKSLKRVNIFKSKCPNVTAAGLQALRDQGLEVITDGNTKNSRKPNEQPAPAK